MVKGASAALAAGLAMVMLSGARAQTDTDCGLHRAFVEETRGPENRDRLGLSIPAAGITRIWAERVYAKKPFRAAAVGVRDQVFVQFEACDPARPVVIGIARPA
jgi:hypothetical protein